MKGKKLGKGRKRNGKGGLEENKIIFISVTDDINEHRNHFFPKYF
jgi:hypothetical protein